MGEDKLKDLLRCLASFYGHCGARTVNQLMVFLHIVEAGGVVPLSQLHDVVGLDEEHCRAVVEELCRTGIPGYGQKLVKVAKFKADAEIMVRLTTSGKLFARSIHETLYNESPSQQG